MKVSQIRLKTSLKDEIIEVLNKQVQREAQTSAIYLSMSSWLQTQGLVHTASFFRKQSEEERTHMFKIFDYILELGAHAISPEIKNIPSDFSNLRDILDEFLELEIKNTESLNHIADLAMKNKDYQTFNLMSWFLQEQIEEEDTARRTIEIYELIGSENGGLFNIDKNIGKMNEA